MAKRRQLLTLDQIESKLGYKIDSLENAAEDVSTFYSDLSAVPKSSHERALRELDEYRKQEVQGTASSHELPLLGVPKVISAYGDTVVAECTRDVGVYRFLVHIYHDSGFYLPVRLTESEASRFMTVTKFQRDYGYNPSSVFFKLPRELRDKIYAFLIPSGEWQLGDADVFNSTTFAGSLGDPTGFYFPLNNNLSILRVNKQIRQEALSIAYRKTFFRLDDMDDFIKIAVSIGQIGRANIQSVEFSWASRSDLRHRMDQTSGFEDNQFQLPALHVLRCVQLLRECRRLEFLRLCFEPDMIANMSSSDFRADPGIRELSSVRGVQKVEIADAIGEPLDQYEPVKWLKEELKSTVYNDQ